MIASYIGENKTFETMYLTGEVELELVPQGTLAERCAAGGKGIPAFYTPAAFGTVVQTGELPLRNNPDGTPSQYSYPKDVKVFEGKQYLLEESIKGDYAFVKAWRADKLGNCQFRLAAHNFNGAMGRNAKMTIVEAEEIARGGAPSWHLCQAGYQVQYPKGNRVYFRERQERSWGEERTRTRQCSCEAGTYR
jgi:3-oxoacid CoA-transferase